MQDQSIFKKLAEDRHKEAEFWKQKCVEAERTNQQSQHLQSLLQQIICFVEKFYEPKSKMADSGLFNREITHLFHEFDRQGLRDYFADFYDGSKSKFELISSQAQHINNQLQGAVQDVLCALERTDAIIEGWKNKISNIEAFSSEIERQTRTFEHNVGLTEKELQNFANSFKAGREPKDPTVFLIEYFKLHQEHLHRFSDMLIAQNRVYRSGIAQFLCLESNSLSEKKIGIVKENISKGMDRLLKSLRLPAIFEEMSARAEVDCKFKEVTDAEVL